MTARIARGSGLWFVGLRDALAEIHYEAWTAAALAGTVAAGAALADVPTVAAASAMAAGLILMWICEEEKRVLAAMADTSAAPMPVPASVPAAPAAALVPANDDRPLAPAVSEPQPDAAGPLRQWANPFPAARSARRPRPADRRAGGRT